MSVRGWSLTAGDNDDADAAINWLEGQLPSTVNGSARAMMTEIKKWSNDIGGAIISAGSGNSYTLTTGQTITTLENGLSLRFRADKTSTGAATVTVDSQAAKSIFRSDGTATVSGDIVSGGVYDLAYSTTAGGFIGVNILGGYQLLDATLTALAGVTTAADKLIYATASDTFTTTDLTAAARTFLAFSTVAAQATGLGLGTGDSPQFTAVNIGHASDTTLARASAGNLTVEGNALYRAGGTDVALADGGTGASTATLGFSALAAEAIAFTGDITPTALSANADNYNPTSLSTASTIRVSTDALRYITGLQGGSDGRVITIINIGTNPLGISTLDGSSSAANQFQLPSSDNLFLGANGSASFRYDATLTKWVLIAFAMTRAGQTVMETATSYSAFVTPAQQAYHPGMPKVWVQGTPNSTTIISSFNVTSLGDTATGQQTVTIGADMTSASYCVLVSVGDTSTTLVHSATVMTKAAGSYIMNSVVEAGSGSDPAEDWNSVAFGTQV